MKWFSKDGPTAKTETKPDAPEKLRYSRYYEHDGALRAYANRAMLLAYLCVPATLIAVALAAYDVSPSRPNRAIGRTFVCSDLTQACGGNRLLFKSKTHRATVPDCYLVVVSAAVYGRIDFSSPVWKSLLSPVIAASCLREQQEAMLLMKAGDWVQTEHGFWQLSRPRNVRDLPALVRIGGPVSI